jgi:hypothetical protein
MGQPSDRNVEIMMQNWGTTSLITDYSQPKKSKMLREINNDDVTPKKHDFIIQNEVHEKIRNENDYDDWEYGTEPIPLQEW